MVGEVQNPTQEAIPVSTHLIYYATSASSTSFSISWHCGFTLYIVNVSSFACYCLVFKMESFFPILLTYKVVWLLILGPFLNEKATSFPTTITPQSSWSKNTYLLSLNKPYPFKPAKPLNTVFRPSRMLLCHPTWLRLFIHAIYN